MQIWLRNIGCDKSHLHLIAAYFFLPISSFFQPTFPLKSQESGLSLQHFVSVVRGTHISLVPPPSITSADLLLFCTTTLKQQESSPKAFSSPFSLICFSCVTTSICPSLLAFVCDNNSVILSSGGKPCCGIFPLLQLDSLRSVAELFITSKIARVAFKIKNGCATAAAACEVCFSIYKTSLCLFAASEERVWILCMCVSQWDSASLTANSKKQKQSRSALSSPGRPLLSSSVLRLPVGPHIITLASLIHHSIVVVFTGPILALAQQHYIKKQ